VSALNLFAVRSSGKVLGELYCGGLCCSTLHRKDALRELIQFVRTNSPFYQKSLANVPTDVGSIEALPITDTNAYWKASSANPNQVMTTAFIDGCVMRSGGSTGTPKIVYMTKSEQKAISLINAHFVHLLPKCSLAAS
jgi:phenylacetate-coenzyme A ligase PaaK-like adenylate-forming protein